MNTVIAFLSGTPWYVYLIFAYVLKVGVKCLNDQIVHRNKLLILPLVFVYLSLDTLLARIHVTSISVSLWLVGMIVGTVFGWLQLARLRIVVDQKQQLLSIQGSAFTLIFLLLTFAVKYLIGYLVVTDAQLNVQLPLLYALLLLSGFFTGVFIGRFALAAYRLKQGPHVDLATS